MNDSISLPYSKLQKIIYKDVERNPDDLELFFMLEISKETGFIINKIRLIEASKSKRSKKIDYFKFKYFDSIYILEKGILKEGNYELNPKSWTVYK